MGDTLEALAGCLGASAGWRPFAIAALVLLALKAAVFRPRLARVGGSVPGLVNLASLLRRGRFRGVAVMEETGAIRFGGGLFVPLGGRGRIRLAPGMLERDDVDALAILEHERGHAERDLPAPRAYRLALLGCFLAGLALALGSPTNLTIGQWLMGGAFAIAALHTLRDEAAASEYALRELWTRDLPSALWRQAITRLGAAYGVYLADWTALGAALLLGGTALGCGRA